MGQTKDQTPKHSGILAASGLSAKSVTDIHVSQAGSTTSIEISFSGGSTFIKVRQGQVEVGGTIEWGTGTTQIF